MAVAGGTLARPYAPACQAFRPLCCTAKESNSMPRELIPMTKSEAICLIDLIGDSGQAFLAAEHGKHVEHTRGGAATGEGGAQRLGGLAELEPFGFRVGANRGLERGGIPTGDCFQPRLQRGEHLSCLGVEKGGGLLVQRERPLGV